MPRKSLTLTTTPQSPEEPLKPAEENMGSSTVIDIVCDECKQKSSPGSKMLKCGGIYQWFNQSSMSQLTHCFERRLDSTPLFLRSKKTGFKVYSYIQLVHLRCGKCLLANYCGGAVRGRREINFDVVQSIIDQVQIVTRRKKGDRLNPCTLFSELHSLNENLHTYAVASNASAMPGLSTKLTALSSGCWAQSPVCARAEKTGRT